MKKFLGLLMAMLMVFSLAGCSRVPEEKLDAVRQKHSEMETMAQRYANVLSELEGIEKEVGMPGLLTYEMKQELNELEDIIAHNKEIVENDLEKMKEEQVDEAIATLDEDLQAANESMPMLETMVAALGEFKDISLEVASKGEEAIGLWNELDSVSEEAQTLMEEYQNKAIEIATEFETKASQLGDEWDDGIEEFINDAKILFKELSEKQDELIAALTQDAEAA